LESSQKQLKKPEIIIREITELKQYARKRLIQKKAVMEE
jgi:hypothetical protein